MRRSVFVTMRWVLVLGLLSASAQIAAQQTTTKPKPFEPTVGQEGKDVVWVPTPQALVDTMLDMAKVTPADYLVDLGSGDGRTVITAAKRGLKALGIEYNPDMVELSKKNAADAGVTSSATFMKADIFETDFSKATVVTMFLLPDINLRLRPKILDMKPGTRIVSNTFTMDEWAADETKRIDDCMTWCTSLLWIVPAKVNGTWKMAGGPLTLAQTFQNVTGTLGSAEIKDGTLRGEQISFVVGGRTYTGKVNANAIQGTVSGGGTWSATR